MPFLLVVQTTAERQEFLEEIVNIPGDYVFPDTQWKSKLQLIGVIVLWVWLIGLHPLWALASQGYHVRWNGHPINHSGVQFRTVIFGIWNASPGYLDSKRSSVNGVIERRSIGNASRNVGEYSPVKTLLSDCFLGKQIYP